MSVSDVSDIMGSPRKTKNATLANYGSNMPFGNAPTSQHTVFKYENRSDSRAIKRRKDAVGSFVKLKRTKTEPKQGD
jgi:hypothetical protein